MKVVAILIVSLVLFAGCSSNGEPIVDNSKLCQETGSCGGGGGGA